MCVRRALSRRTYAWLPARANSAAHACLLRGRPVTQAAYWRLLLGYRLATSVLTHLSPGDVDAARQSAESTLTGVVEDMKKYRRTARTRPPPCNAAREPRTHGSG